MVSKEPVWQHHTIMSDLGDENAPMSSSHPPVDGAVIDGSFIDNNKDVDVDASAAARRPVTPPSARNADDENTTAAFHRQLLQQQQVLAEQTAQLQATQLQVCGPEPYRSVYLTLIPPPFPFFICPLHSWPRNSSSNNNVITPTRRMQTTSTTIVAPELEEQENAEARCRRLKSCKRWPRSKRILRGPQICPPRFKRVFSSQCP